MVVLILMNQPLDTNMKPFIPRGMALSKTLSSLSELFFPRLCIPCGRKLMDAEQFLCIHCWQDLPRTHYHSDPDNKVAQLFWGRAKISRATAWLLFRKGSHYQLLVHYLKYKGYHEIGRVLGYQFGLELKYTAFANNDLVIPVPLHNSRLKKRGYNQSEMLAAGLSESLHITLLAKALQRTVSTATQTKKNRFERWQNVAGIFQVIHPEAILGKQILLVDDVITTGATLEAAVNSLLEAGAKSIDIAALAVADF